MNALPGASDRRTGVTVGLSVVLALVLVAGLWSELALRLNYDVGWLITAAERALDGRRLYAEIIEINPPLIVWLTQVPVLLGRAVGISPILAFRLFVLAMIAVSIALVRNPARAALGRNHTNFLLLASAAFVPLTWKYFGEREHLATILLTPYLVANAREATAATTRRSRIAAGALAGIGFSLKPHFVPLFLISVLIPRRPWRKLAGSEHQAAAVGVMILYALAALPGLGRYLNLVHLYGGLYWQLLHRPILEVLFGHAAGLTGIASMLAYAGLRPTLRRRGVPDSLALGCCWFLVAAALQGKGLSYHYYPAFVLGLLTLGWVLLDPAPRVPSSSAIPFRPIAASLLAGALALGGARTVWSLVDDVGPTAGRFGELVRMLDTLAPGGTFASLDVELGENFPAANYTTATWDLGWPSIWFIEPVYRDQLRQGAVLRIHEPVRMPPAERAAYSSVVKQLVDRHPDVLLFRRSVPGAVSGTDRFDFLRYFTQDSSLSSLLGRCYRRLPDTIGRAVFLRGEPIGIHARASRVSSAAVPASGAGRCP
jgi:hypothetical protein